MMKNIAYAVVAMAALGACDGVGGSDGDGGTGGPTDPVTPINPDAQVIGELQGVGYDADNEELSVQISLDGGSADLEPYTRGGIPINGYIRFFEQGDELSRYSTAYARQSSDGSVEGAVVSVGGRLNKFVGGAAVVQNSYSVPENGEIRYAGNYVGLLNFGPPAPGTPAGTPDGFAPSQATPVTGRVLITADFNANPSLEGLIFERTYGPDGTGTAMRNVVLAVGSISANGSFSGTAETDQTETMAVAQGIGSYQGVFGGTNASAIAGTLLLTDPIPNLTLDQEYGIFVLDQCASPTACVAP